MNINKQFFTSLSQSALDFYREAGYVCISSVVSREQLGDVQHAWSTLSDRYASEISVGRDQYLSEISQWRDLWKEDSIFQNLLAENLFELAAWGMELPGARLLHDHFIRKQGAGSNGVIPWHQDSMYWPLDRTGCSTWLAVDDVSIRSGCLEVVAGSHLGEAEEPVDFMADAVHFDKTQITALPVNAGDVVLMSSKTWHRSQPIVSGVRLAHIALWVPSQTSYAPEKASWHPLNEKVSVQPGGLLNEDEFPVFGCHSKEFGSSDANKHSGVEHAHGMFNARLRVEAFVQRQTGNKGSLAGMLHESAQRKALAEICCQQHGKEKYDDYLRLVERVWISASAYEKHRSRNVFNSAYQAWETCFSEDIDRNDRN